MHQERHYPGRVIGTDLVNPDFATLRRAFGATASGSSAPRTSRPPSSVPSRPDARRARARVDPEAITPRQTLSEIREQAIARLSTSRDLPPRSRNPTEDGASSMASRTQPGDRGVARRGLGAGPRLQRTRELARRARVRSDIEDGKAGDQVGRGRSFTLTDGTHLREKLLRSRITSATYTDDFQKTPFDVDNYCATVRVTPRHGR